MRAEVVEVFANESAADLAQRRPDLFRLAGADLIFRGLRSVEFVHRPAPIPVSICGGLDDARSLMARAFQRSMETR